VTNPAHRAGHLKKLEEGDCIPHTPAPLFIPAINGGVFCGSFINIKRFFICNFAMCLFIPSYLYGQIPKPSAKEIYELKEKCGKRLRDLFEKHYSPPVIPKETLPNFMHCRAT
jgi:hypothetical protein